jgi:hypothetical protein
VSASEHPKETVILVHGTWAQPVEGKPRWYQRIEGPEAKKSFIAKLDAALERHGSRARCWAHCKQDDDPYYWSGKNTWIERNRAASQLARRVRDLRSQGWKCHVIAHSHGGNIALEAGPAILGETVTAGTIVTLGTPFIDTASSVHRQQAIIEKWSAVFALVSLAILVSSMPLLASLFIGSAPGAMGWPLQSTEPEFFERLLRQIAPGVSIETWLQIIIVGFASLLFLMIFLMYRAWRTVDWESSRGWRSFWQLDVLRPVVLCLGSRYDEAMTVLSHLSVMKDPIRPRWGLLGSIAQRQSVFIDQTEQIGQLTGRTLKNTTIYDKAYIIFLYISPLVFFIAYYFGFHSLSVKSAFLVWCFWIFMMILLKAFLAAVGVGTISELYAIVFPVIFLSRRIQFLSTIPSIAVEHLVRTRAWRLATAAALGIEGYSHPVPEVRDVPAFAPRGLVKYENLSDDVRTRALARRNEWALKHFGSASDAFAKEILTAADLERLLELVVSDLGLVHAAYYTDDECIDRIARWIAGKD